MSQFKDAFLFTRPEPPGCRSGSCTSTASRTSRSSPSTGRLGPPPRASCTSAEDSTWSSSTAGSAGGRGCRVGGDGRRRAGRHGRGRGRRPGRDRVAIFEAEEVDPRRDRWSSEHGGRTVTFVAAPGPDGVPAHGARGGDHRRGRRPLAGDSGCLRLRAAARSGCIRARYEAAFEELDGALESPVSTPDNLV